MLKCLLEIELMVLVMCVMIVGGKISVVVVVYSWIFEVIVVRFVINVNDFKL